MSARLHPGFVLGVGSSSISSAWTREPAAYGEPRDTSYMLEEAVRRIPRRRGRAALQPVGSPVSTS